MGKRHAQRQKEYRERLKSKNREEYLRKDRERKKRQRELLKNSEEKYEMYKLKEWKREKTKKQNMTLSDPATSSSPKNSFTTKQAFGKVTARAKKNLPKRSRRKREVISFFLHLQKIMHLKPLEENLK